MLRFRENERVSQGEQFENFANGSHEPMNGSYQHRVLKSYRQNCDGCVVLTLLGTER